MKKMISNIKTLAALLMAGAAFTACSSSDDNIIEQSKKPTEPQVYTLVIKASKGDDAITRALSGGDGYVSARWDGTETIVVVQDNGITKTEIGTATAAPNVDGGETTITATLNSAPTGALHFVLGGTTFDYTGQNGILASHPSVDTHYISKDHDFAVATLAADKYDIVETVITPKGGVTLNFLSNQAIVKFTLKDKANDAAINPSSLTIHVSNNNLRQSYNYLTGAETFGDITITPARNTNEIYASLCGVGSDTEVTLTATVGGDTYTYTKSNVTFVHDKYYEITVKMNMLLPEGALRGKFTINAGGDKVRFSKGNLQAYFASAGSSCTWNFAPNQWSYVGNNSANINIDGIGTVGAGGFYVDLFGWVGNSSSWTSDAAIHGISKSTATNAENGYGTSATENLKSDWGKTIDGTGTTWRTLSGDEWVYVFNTRTTGGTVGETPQARYTMANIRTDVSGGVNGVILFPDGINFTASEFTTLGTVNDESAWGTRCTSAEWTALAAKGCVFLPAAGDREAASVYQVETHGHYWSSSPDADYVTGAYAVYFYSGSLNPKNAHYRNYGFSVRLVRPVE